MNEKKPHRIVFFILFAICIIAMLPPIVYVSNTPDVVLGIPKFLAWVFGWGFIVSVLLLIMYYFDTKFEETHN